MDRSSFSSYDSVAHIWQTLELPNTTLEHINLPQDAECYPSSFKISILAQSAISASALAAAHFWSIRHQCSVPRVTVAAEHACVEFKSERLYILNGKAAPSSWGTIGGLHKTSDGYVRMHDSFPNHRENALKILGLDKEASREHVAEKMLKWKCVELESIAVNNGAVIAALRSIEEWDALPQAEAIPDFPVLLSRLAPSAPYIPRSVASKRCLGGVRVVEMSRVVAAPVAGKTLAAHGAEVLWITSPTLPDLPDLDIDLSRGKRTVQLNIKRHEDKTKILELVRTADIFIQSYRPGSLAAQGLSAKELIKLNPNLIIANLNAYGSDGPWSQNRGFDSLVQTCSGINVADAKRCGSEEPARVLPCQALDHGAGYLLAAGIITALSKRATEGGAYEINVSLAGVMKYLRSLGQYEGESGFKRKDFKGPEEVETYLESRQTSFGELKAVRPATSIEGLQVGYENMPKPLGSDDPIWS